MGKELCFGSQENTTPFVLEYIFDIFQRPCRYTFQVCLGFSLLNISLCLSRIM
jgi:hypothetical protein